jgi:hypothetical protein
MFRLLVSLLGLIAFLAGSFAAPVPAHLMPKTGPLYYPTKVGTKWVYLVNGKEQSKCITKAEVRDGATLVTVERAGEPTCWLVSGSGVCLVSQGRHQFVQPIPFLKLPHGPGATWEAVSRAEGEVKGVFGEPTLSFAARGPETVEVPAGKLLAIRVEVTYVGNQKATYWFAPGIGVVKKTGLGDYTEELKSFTSAKE